MPARNLKSPRALSILAAAGLFAVAAAPALALAQTGDAAKGEIVFAKCAACHSVKPGETRLGPSLYGLIGRKSGSAPGYEYSPAMKAKGVTWNATTLEAYLPAPRAYVPGTKMLFVGLSNPVDRANVIAYLSTLGPAK